MSDKPSDAETPAYNPYAPPIETSVLPAETPLADAPRRSWLKSLGIWTLVCVVSALPSFGWAISTVASEQFAAMITGICIFIGLYTVGDQLTQQSAWRRNRSIRTTLKIGYFTRITISILFPIGGFVDMLCGILSIATVGVVLSRFSPDGPNGFGSDPGFEVTLALTLFQGMVLNLLLLGYMTIVFGFVVLAHRHRVPDFEADKQRMD